MRGWRWVNDDDGDRGRRRARFWKVAERHATSALPATGLGTSCSSMTARSSVDNTAAVYKHPSRRPLTGNGFTTRHCPPFAVSSHGYTGFTDLHQCDSDLRDYNVPPERGCRGHFRHAEHEACSERDNWKAGGSHHQPCWSVGLLVQEMKTARG